MSTSVFCIVPSETRALDIVSRLRACVSGSDPAMLGTVLLIVLVLLLLGSVPAYPYSRKWGYGPSGVLGTLVIILLVLLLMGRL